MNYFEQQVADSVASLRSIKAKADIDPAFSAALLRELQPINQTEPIVDVTSNPKKNILLRGLAKVLDITDGLLYLLGFGLRLGIANILNILCTGLHFLAWIAAAFYGLGMIIIFAIYALIWHFEPHKLTIAAHWHFWQVEGLCLLTVLGLFMIEGVLFFGQIWISDKLLKA